MADSFGNLDLFSEFDKEREAQGSFIRYDEDNVRSRIIFEDFDDDNDESDSEDENKTEANDFYSYSLSISKSKSAEPGLNSDEKTRKHEINEKIKTQIDAPKSTASQIEKEDDCTNSNTTSPCDTPNTEIRNNVFSRNGSIVDRQAQLPISDAGDSRQISEGNYLSAEDAEKIFWINEHFYAEAAEEAQNVSSVQQLIFERNKYRKYAKMLDSTRYVPDDESPAVQLIFNNNNFARRHRQQIEQFIKGLLWEEFNTSKPEPVPEITVKPGAPSCIDINEKLPPNKRREKMRQKHAIIGSSQFHQQFLIDFLGWPFPVSEPPRCSINWEVPLYGQVFNEVYADPANKNKKPVVKKHRSSCWNCGEENHSVAECKQPRNAAKIAASRVDFMAQKQQNQSNFDPKFTGPSRYHLDPELPPEFSKFKPGVISEALHQALGLAQDQLPQHIYKMRQFGYPPGWLAEAKQVQSGVTIFDKNGRVTLITGECLEDGELQEEGASSRAEFDLNKIIEYPGFTVPVPEGFNDEHSTFKMPPIQQHQLKKTLISQMTKQSSSRKRKNEKNSENTEKAKRSRNAEIGREDGEYSEGQEDEAPLVYDSVEADSRTERVTEAESSDVPVVPSLPTSSSTISLSCDFGTPVLTREKSGLPDASKFGQGIQDHINFENLPDSTGTFEKMRDLLFTIRNKYKKTSSEQE